ncbi:MAG: hypothetical protein Q8K45_01200 [Rubrivivax sp.]|nr:hypothetical protein [Rubrivivax sp.]
MTPVHRHHPGTPGAAPRWSTTSFGDSADTRPVELSALGEHVSLCRGASGGLALLQRAGQAVHGVVAARFVTTLAVVGVVIAALLVVFQA